MSRDDLFVLFKELVEKINSEDSNQQIVQDVIVFNNNAMILALRRNGEIFFSRYYYPEWNWSNMMHVGDEDIVAAVFNSMEANGK